MTRSLIYWENFKDLDWGSGFWDRVTLGHVFATKIHGSQSRLNLRYHLSIPGPVLCVFFFLCDGCHVQPQERHRKGTWKQSSLCSSVLERESHCMPQGSRFHQAGKKPREHKDLWASALLGVRSEYKRKGARGFHWCIWMLVGLGREGRKENLCQGPAFTCSSGQDAYSQFVGILRQQAKDVS